MIALVLGGANCLFDDIEMARELVEPDTCTVLAVNDAGFAYPGRLDHWVSMHAEEFPERQRIRAARGYPGGFTRWTRPYPAGLKHLEGAADELFAGWNGSSGLLAVGIALEHLEVAGVILCGIPLDDRPHFNRKGRWPEHDRYRLGWMKHHDRMEGCVKSFNGWTRELLGEPTVEWVLDRQKAAV